MNEVGSRIAKVIEILSNPLDFKFEIITISKVELVLVFSLPF